MSVGSAVSTPPRATASGPASGAGAVKPQAGLLPGRRLWLRLPLLLLGADSMIEDGARTSAVRRVSVPSGCGAPRRGSGIGSGGGGSSGAPGAPPRIRAFHPRRRAVSARVPGLPETVHGRPGEAADPGPRGALPTDVRGRCELVAVDGSRRGEDHRGDTERAHRDDEHRDLRVDGRSFFSAYGPSG